MQNCAVTAEHHQEIGLAAQVQNRMSVRDPGERRRSPLHQDRQALPLELLRERPRELGHARLSRMRNQADFVRTHAKNSWLPSVPVIAAGTIPTSSWPA